MSFNIELNHEDVNKAIAQAIIDSHLGEEIEKAVNGALIMESTGYHSAKQSVVSNAVRVQVSREVEKCVSEQYGEVIRKSVQAHMENREFLDEMWEVVSKRILGTVGETNKY